jgi:hypothetical protein
MKLIGAEKQTKTKMKKKGTKGRAIKKQIGKGGGNNKMNQKKDNTGCQGRQALG